MAITVTWTINETKWKKSDGGVYEVRWRCQDEDGSEGMNANQAAAMGEFHYTADPSSGSFKPLDELTPEIVLGWVKATLDAKEQRSDMTSTELEDLLKAKVQAKIDNEAANSTGLPWSG